MKERPILFNGAMVHAILNGHKTQTRRICKNNTPPYAQGDRLWVRETWSETELSDGTRVVAYRAGGCRGVNEAEGKKYLMHKWTWPIMAAPSERGWRPSIHMPRWCSRISLQVVHVRQERLQGISKADAIAEGVESLDPSLEFWANSQEEAKKVCFPNAPLDSYKALWESINGPGSWRRNPLVWVISFGLIEP